jgi:NAD(P)H-flavin reductase
MGTIMEIRLDGGGASARISLPPGMRPSPGQYLTASLPGSPDPLPVTLFPSQILPGEILCPFPAGSSWQAGGQIRLRGPLGRGFALPPTTRRLALAAMESLPTRLLPLMDLALASRASVAVYAPSVPRGLPEEVEILPLDLLPEAPAWADFLALETSLTGLPHLRDHLGLKPFARLACAAQVLVATAMPCAGSAECGVCAVRTRDGWALACSDGPVFDFGQLEG